MAAAPVVQVPMPRLSDSMEEGTIVSWLQEDGAEIRRGAALAEIETDKATMVYEADGDGFLAIVAQAGATVEVGGPIAELHPAPSGSRDGGRGADADPSPELARSPLAREPAGGLGSTDGDRSRPVARDSRRGGASPVAGRLAARLGVDLATLRGSGPRGRVLKRDVAGAQPPVGAAVHRGPTGSAAPPAPTPKGAVTRQELSRTQRTIARRMAEAKATVPDFAISMDVDMTAAVELRDRLKADVDYVPSLNDMIVKAVAAALRSHPRLNGSYRDEGFELHERINVGIAVAADDALLVPAIADADRLSLGALAVLSRDLADRARAGTITAADLAGGTFTISNLGMLGVRSFTPIINPPQAAILGVGEVARRPVVLEDGTIAARAMTSLTLVCDHRIVYGADASGFLRDVKTILESPLRLVV